MCSAPHAMNSALSVGLLLAFGCAVFAADGDDTVTRLTKLGAECKYDEKGNLIAVDFGFQPLATGDDLSILKGQDHVVDVAISEMNLRSDGLKHLASLPKLERLDASKTKCTDNDIRHLAGLQSLVELELDNTAVTDASIPTLTKLQNLRWIDLSSTRVTPEGLRRLRRELPKLHVNESWDYFTGYVGGRGVLDMDRATIVFAYMHAPATGGAGGGSSILVSKSVKGDENVAAVGGGVINANSIVASSSRKNGIPIIHVGKHRIEIKGEGTELIIDGQPFPIGRDKLRIVVDADGVATLDK